MGKIRVRLFGGSQYEPFPVLDLAGRKRIQAVFRGREKSRCSNAIQEWIRRKPVKAAPLKGGGMAVELQALDHKLLAAY